jgi:hypothetical protein
MPLPYKIAAAFKCPVRGGEKYAIVFPSTTNNRGDKNVYE